MLSHRAVLGKPDWASKVAHVQLLHAVSKGADARQGIGIKRGALEQNGMSGREKKEKRKRRRGLGPRGPD